VSQDLIKKLDDKCVEIMDGLNDISKEFDNINCKFFNENIDALQVDQFKSNFKDLVKKDDEVTRTFNSDSIDRLVSCHNFRSRLKKLVSKLKRFLGKVAREIETKNMVNHYACGLEEEE
ncbi:hypothetical protein KI387_017794, partial [Taxus chinensis]